MMLGNLVWAAFTPKGFDELNREEAITSMKSYIKAVMKHYKGKVGNYVVVNEPHLVGGTVADDPLRRIIGPDYVDIAFQTAREEDPSAFLIFNETDNHGPEGKYVQDTTDIGNELYAKGLIDAVGVQGHLAYTDDGGPWAAPTEDQMFNTLSRYKPPIILTEVDATLQGVKSANRLHVQSEWYRRLIRAALRTGRLKGIFLMGGFPDHNSWMELGQHIQNADPTPWDDNFNPKPAYYAIQQALYSAAPH